MSMIIRNVGFWIRSHSFNSLTVSYVDFDEISDRCWSCISLFTDIIAYSELAIRNNAAVVEYCRTSMAALSGGTSGLLGLTGFYGFGFYVFAVVGLWVSSSSNLSNTWMMLRNS